MLIIFAITVIMETLNIEIFYGITVFHATAILILLYITIWLIEGALIEIELEEGGE